MRGVSLLGLGLRDTAYTYMDPHGIPSGGDWTLERSAVVLLEGTEQVTVSGCVFERVDGNAVLRDEMKSPDAPSADTGPAAEVCGPITKARATPPMAATRKLLDALAAVSDHGPRVDVTLDSVSHTVRVPLRATGLTRPSSASPRAGPFPPRPRSPWRCFPTSARFSPRARPR